jgi:hypothetical protein
MELWLIVGALVLVALTVWIVWTPERPRGEEVKPVTVDANGTNLTPQGDKFEAQHTPATGGVATAAHAYTPPARSPSSEPWSSPTMAREGVSQPWSAGGTANFDADHDQGMGLLRPGTLGIGAGALLAVAGGIGGAWLYGRWQRERNRPINRLRRGALDVAHRLGDRLPMDTDDLPEAAGPVSGAAAALLLTSLVLARAFRKDDSSLEAHVDHSRDVLSDALDIGRKEARRRMSEIDVEKSMAAGRKMSRKLRDQIDLEKSIDQGRKQFTSERKPAMLGGLGIGGVALLAGLGYVIWRLMRGGESPSPSGY